MPKKIGLSAIPWRCGTWPKLIKGDVFLRSHATDDVAKYRDQFRRRVTNGKCHHTPYLGCREFTGFFGDPDRSERPINLTDDLGLILFDLDYEQGTSGRGRPQFFSARLEGGILKVLLNCIEKEG